MNIGNVTVTLPVAVATPIDAFRPMETNVDTVGVGTDFGFGLTG